MNECINLSQTTGKFDNGAILQRTGSPFVIADSPDILSHCQATYCEKAEKYVDSAGKFHAGCTAGESAG
jgi:hypothetical protein